MNDLISRQQAIDAVEKNACNTQRIMDAVNNLPSVQPERKTGHWKHINEEEERAKHDGQLLGWMPWYCSECGCGVGKHQTAFCPNCGADMRGGEDE